MRQVIVSLLLGTSLVPGWAVRAEQSFAAYVYTGDPKTGFVDPAAEDSVADLKRALADGSSMLRVTEAREMADLSIRILGRRKAPSGDVAVSAQKWTDKTSTAQARSVDQHEVYAVLEVGDYALEMDGVHTRSWGAAAGKLADQIVKWVERNQTQLRKIREGRRTDAPR